MSFSSTLRAGGENKRARERGREGRRMGEREREREKGIQKNIRLLSPKIVKQMINALIERCLKLSWSHGGSFQCIHVYLVVSKKSVCTCT